MRLLRTLAVAAAVSLAAPLMWSLAAALGGWSAVLAPLALLAWYGHVRVVSEAAGVSLYPGWPGHGPAWAWLAEDLLVYVLAYSPALVLSSAWSAVRAAFSGQPAAAVLAAVSEARERLAGRYQARLARRAGRRVRAELLARGHREIERYLDAHGALWRVDQVRTRGQDGRSVVQSVRTRLAAVAGELVVDSEDRCVVRYTVRYLRPEPQVLRVWRALPSDLPQLLGVPAERIMVDPSGAIVWIAVGDAPGTEQALPEAPAEPELPDPEIWSQGLADDDGGPLVEGGPPVELLSPPTRGRGRPQEGRTAARRVLAALARLGAPDAAVDRIQVGPGIVAVTVSPPPGITASALARAAGGLAEELGAEGVTYRSRADGRPGIVVAVLRERRDPVPLRALLSAPGLDRMALPVAVGVGADGSPLALDLGSAPHLLLAGTTGSGKSVGMTAAIVTQLMFRSPDAVRYIMCDPKMVEFTPFERLPHLLCPVLHESSDMQSVVPWLTGEMDRRYKLFAQEKVRELSEYNSKVNETDRLPRIVLVVDELSDLLMAGDKAARKDVEAGLIRIAQKARAAGIHLMLATQKPTVEVVPSLLKANVPTRVAYKTMTQVESQVIMDRPGAELLAGKGDLYVLRGDGTMIRGQGAFVSGQEAEAVAEWWAGQVQTAYEPSLLAAMGGGTPVSVGVRGGGGPSDPPGEEKVDDNDGW